jgi:hypothetical protein
MEELQLAPRTPTPAPRQPHGQGVLLALNRV